MDWAIPDFEKALEDIARILHIQHGGGNPRDEFERKAKQDKADRLTPSLWKD